MEIKFDITRYFEKDLKQLGAEDQSNIAISINRYAATFDIWHGGKSQHIYQPHKILLPNGLDSSLYVLRATDQIRVILAIDEDPLFDQKIVTLIRVVKHDDLDRAFNSIAKSLYQQLHAGDNNHG